jgi:hypothetical protein
MLPAYIVSQFELASDPTVPLNLGGTNDSVAYFTLSNLAGAVADSGSATAAVTAAAPPPAEPPPEEHRDRPRRR